MAAASATTAKRFHAFALRLRLAKVRRPSRRTVADALMLLQERVDQMVSCNEVSGQLGERHSSDHEHRNAMVLDGSTFVRLVANALVVRDDDPAVATCDFEPLDVRRVRPEVISMAFDAQPAAAQDLRELLSQIPVGEEDARQAAR